MLCPAIVEFRDRVALKLAPRHAAGRIKQWFNWLRQRYPQAGAISQRIRPLLTLAEIDQVFVAAGVSAMTPREEMSCCAH
jgi:tRNA-dihydrouridine synthase C